MMWQDKEFLIGHRELEDGIAHNAHLCQFVWENPRDDVTVDWNKVLVVAIDDRKHSTVRMMKSNISSEQWRNMYERALQDSKSSSIPFPDLNSISL